MRVAAGDSDGVSKLYLHDFSFMHSMKVAKDINRSIDVKVVTTGSLVKFIKLPRVDFIKVDVEGMELEVLSGCKYTIERFKPSLIIEANKNNLREVLILTENARMAEPCMK